MRYYSNHPPPWVKVVWHKYYALRYAAFHWFSMMGGLKTMNFLLKRGILTTPLYCFCIAFDETIYHQFFKYKYSFDILTHVIP